MNPGDAMVNVNATVVLDNVVAVNWAPFRTLPPGSRTPPMRSARTRQGVLDRLSLVAFAELQAKEGFLWAIQNLKDASDGLRIAWGTLAQEEEKHLNWLLSRIRSLEGDPSERPFPLDLWESFTRCRSAEEFCRFMARAEDRGRVGREKLALILAETDVISAELFGLIAREEQAHIQLTEQFFSTAAHSDS